MSLHINSIPTIEILSDDILLAIFRHVKFTDRPKLASVSNRWCRLIDASYSDVESLSMTSTICNQSCTCLEPFYTALRLCGAHIKELRLDMKDRYIDNVTLDHIRDHCDPNKLKKLHMEGVQIDTQTFLPLLGHFPAISSLTLHRIDRPAEDPEVYASLIGQCPHLRILDIEGCRHLSPRTLEPLHRTLIEFRADDCTLGSGTLSQLLRYDLDLELLSLRCCYVESDDLLFVCQRARNLRYLQLSTIIYKREHETFHLDLFTAIGALRNLQQLHLCGPHSILGQYLRVRDESIQFFATTNKPTTITTLCIWGNRLITDTGILHLASFTQLTRLDLSHLGGRGARGGGIHDWSLSQLVCSGVNKLTHVYCCNCQNLTGSFMSTFLSQCPDLVLIGIAGCSKIDDSAVRRCIDLLADRKHRFTICMAGTRVTVASMISNPDFRGLRLHFDWSPCAEHGHECECDTSLQDHPFDKSAIFC